MLLQSWRFVKYSGVKYGAIAGIIATWSISTTIAASEVELGLPMSTFYSVMGMSFGYEDFVAAAYLGFGLHLVTGTALGAVIGLASVKWIRIMINPYKAVMAGIVAGIAVWLVLFLPVTVLLVQPSIQHIVSLLPEDTQGILSGNSQFIAGIVSSAIVFHMVWGAIFGYISSSLMRIMAFRTSHAVGGMQK
ncbi:hypothetical protein Ngar_c13090 [Candidatus Nitrososphaera gargensis Ga9.2]|uniref:Uncharacterized protein n=1 Tax=Nitrososphaera gargensis (strain Ga9.2) TaxID=1237085 RepID=K0IJ65_NITGG|nr:hypothetical protein [Candidatus Nitrososphaera gargensis]AFU58247.1 hypothetical protein Ngar_c13090 [Candidatus Nitrososphaera gargensis Ga9.2]